MISPSRNQYPQLSSNLTNATIHIKDEVAITIPKVTDDSCKWKLLQYTFQVIDPENRTIPTTDILWIDFQPLSRKIIITPEKGLYIVDYLKNQSNYLSGTNLLPLRFQLNISDGYDANVQEFFVRIYNHQPDIKEQIQNQRVHFQTYFEFVVSITQFKDSDQPMDKKLVLSAQLQNGSALPNWIQFSPKSRSFFGVCEPEEFAHCENALTQSTHKECHYPISVFASDLYSQVPNNFTLIVHDFAVMQE